MHEEEFVIKNQRGKRLVCALRTPDPNMKQHPNGVFVLLHGLGGWKDQYLLVVVAESMRAAGYYVVTFDAADGAKGPDGNFVKSTNTGYVEDVEDLFAYIKTQPWYEGEIILGGHSQGGLVATRFTALHQNLLNRLVIIAPAVTWTSTLPWGIPFGLWWLVRNKHKTPGPGPRGSMLPLDRVWLLDYLKFDIVRDAKRITIPTLIISAENDNLINTSEHAKLVKHFESGTLKVIENANHIFFRHEHEVAATLHAWRTS